MARSRPRTLEAAPDAGAAESPTSLPTIPNTTGRYIVRFRERTGDNGRPALMQLAGVRDFAAADEAGAVSMAALQDADVVFDRLGMAVISVAPDAASAVAQGLSDEDKGIVSIRPEMIFYPLTVPPDPVPGPFFPPTPEPIRPAPLPAQDYVRGFRDGVTALANSVLGAPAPAQPLPGWGGPGVGVAGVFAADPFNSDKSATWGLDVTKVLMSPYSGRGVKVAVIDSGLDVTHPDFAGRNIVTQSFVNEPFQDSAGHGTHVTGTACGPKVSGSGIRYGIAYEADIYAARVIGSNGQGGESGILAAIQWAMAKGCRVANMSLGIPWKNLQGVPSNFIQQILNDYEAIANHAIDQNLALIAAAGNDSNRPGQVLPVGIPACSSKILAVAALDRDASGLQVAFFSNGGGFAGHPGGVDIAAPGVNVYSAWPTATPRWGRYNVISGTSMATPHVTGIAALMAQARPAWTAANILYTLMGMARPLPFPPGDVGKGLVLAYQDNP